ncbi:MAG: ABC transporter ATP-binding protein [Canibacter sp.]
MATVSLNSVSLTYPDGHVGLTNIDLSIGDGEFIALVGPSGSGKTTLLRTIAGFVSPSNGTVVIDGETVSSAGHSLEPERRGLGMVFQQHAVWPHWNVAKNVEYPLKMAGVGRAERKARVAETLELVGLSGYEKRNPATLSGGQRQRVALARAVVSRPRVLLLDEALSALDEPLRDRLRLELRMLARELGLTVIHVTHDRNEAIALADRVVVLDGGRVQQVGTPAQLLQHPESSFVAKFLADANVFPGRVDSYAAHAIDLPVSIERSRVDSVDAVGSSAVELAVLPEHVGVRPDAAGEARVLSSLFGRDGDDLVIEWDGNRLRSRQFGVRCDEGDRVHVEISHAFAYAASTIPRAAKNSADDAPEATQFLPPRDSAEPTTQPALTRV